MEKEKVKKNKKLKNQLFKKTTVIKNQEFLEGWKRCQADFENYKKRQEKEKKEMVLFSNLNLIGQLLPVIDNFNASTAHIPEDQKDNAWVTGIMYIQKQLETVLNDFGVTDFEVKVGDKFNPEIHEAVKEKKDNLEKNKKGEEEKEEKNIIKKVLQKGYKMKDKIIRPARVIVS